jgi:hypothetical protein
VDNSKALRARDNELIDAPTVDDTDFDDSGVSDATDDGLPMHLGEASVRKSVVHLCEPW